MVSSKKSVCLLSIILLLFVTVSITLGADRPGKSLRERATIPARFAPVYSFPGYDNVTYTADAKGETQRALGASFWRGNPDTLGTTPYDYQHNCSMTRQVEHRAMYLNPPNNLYGDFIHFDWMALTGFNPAVNRGIGYQAYEIAACDRAFAQGGIRIEGNYAGYVAIDADPGGWAVPAAHQREGTLTKSKAYWDFVSGGPAYGLFTPDAPADVYGWYLNEGTGPGNENVWPAIEWDVDGSGDPVLHMIASERGGALGDPQTVSYYRRVGPYGTNAGVWSDQRVVDSIMSINATVASSPVSDRVAIVWLAPADFKRDQANEFDNQLENDVWFAIADDNGAAWANNPTFLGNPSIGHLVDQGIGNPGVAGVGGNITLTTALSEYKPYCDLSALFTTEDQLNMVWNTRRWIDTLTLYRRQAGLFHWQEGDAMPTGGRPVAKALWDSGGACLSHDWGGDVSKPSISECDGKLYVLFTQFGRADNPCGDVDPISSIVNGYMYMSVFDPIYMAWDKPQRVTNTPETPEGCVRGDNGTCNSEHWGSMARYGRIDTCQFADLPVLDIMFINDKAPGGAVQEESGFWTNNPIIWWAYPCREAVVVPEYSDDAGDGYGICYGAPILVVAPGNQTTVVLTMENDGLLPNTISAIDVTSDDPDVTVTVTCTEEVPFDIPVDGAMPCDVTVSAAASADDESTVSGTITVTHEAAGSPRVIPYCVTVSSTYVPLEDATLATACKRLRLYNNGELSNNATNAALDFNATYDPDDCGNIYLFDGSPIVCRKVGNERRCFFSAYTTYPDSNTMRQVSNLTVDSTGNEAYSYATTEFITADSSIKLIAEYFFPKGADDCSYMIQKLRAVNLTGSRLDSVAIGEVLDWDVPVFDPDNSGNNSAYDAGRNLIYQYCCDDDPCDSALACNRAAGIAAAKQVGTLYNGFRNYFTLENDVFVYQTGPFGTDAPMPSDTIYGLMTKNTGYITADIGACEDLSTLVTFDVYSIGTTDTVCVVKILSTSREDSDGGVLKANIDKANAFILAHPEIKCAEGPEPCECKPGDANNDGQVNVGDAVSLINFVFKGGPAPRPYAICSGDANKDCQANVGDAVFIINFVFKGGPAPADCESWRTKCGPTIH